MLGPGSLCNFSRAVQYRFEAWNSFLGYVRVRNEVGVGCVVRADFCVDVLWYERRAEKAAQIVLRNGGMVDESSASQK